MFLLIILIVALAVLVAFAVLCYWTEGCDDVSRQACHDLMSSNSDLCNDACLSSVCARTCGKCSTYCKIVLPKHTPFLPSSMKDDKKSGNNLQSPDCAIPLLCDW